MHQLTYHALSLKVPLAPASTWRSDIVPAPHSRRRRPCSGGGCQEIADLDGDGRAEVLTGTPAAPAGSQQAGLVRIHSGADARVLHRIQGPAAWGWFGMSLAAGADVDGDGAPEFMVGTPGHDDHTEIMGRVRAFSGLPL